MLDNYPILIVSAQVRYWDDAIVNGIQDNPTDPRIPFATYTSWDICIDWHTGQILQWPKGTTASIHYKVCDGGQYWLADRNLVKAYKYKGDYVPTDLLNQRISDSDYIVFNIDASGSIISYEKPELDPEYWIKVK